MSVHHPDDWHDGFNEGLRCAQVGERVTRHADQLVGVVIALALGWSGWLLGREGFTLVRSLCIMAAQLTAAVLVGGLGYRALDWLVGGEDEDDGESLHVLRRRAALGKHQQ
jgi:hypothetical protein